MLSILVQLKCVRAMLKGVMPDEAQRHQLMLHQTFHMTGNEQTPIWLASTAVQAP